MAIYEPHDRFYRKARAKGLPSRAAFKLEEILARYRIAAKGAKVADLGCAPGGWLAILAREVGPTGRVVGIDLAQSKAPAGTIAIVADLREPEIASRAIEILGGTADLITSDLAPKLTGIAARDEARSRELIAAAIEFAGRALRPGGSMVAKLFMGAEFKDAVAEFERCFERVDVVRTVATRPGSAELYVVARGLRAPGNPTD
ncbi:MAG TPA: RlmE family RNA methyltransferase [Candidatus Binataceae bacterium]|nr:RlmE family RNA methyltransferase [Candidatus Binataceae bacterium]